MHNSFFHSSEWPCTSLDTINGGQDKEEVQEDPACLESSRWLIFLATRKRSGILVPSPVKRCHRLITLWIYFTVIASSHEQRTPLPMAEHCREQRGDSGLQRLQCQHKSKHRDTDRRGVFQQNRNQMSDHNKFARSTAVAEQYPVFSWQQTRISERDWRKGDKILVENFS